MFHHISFVVPCCHFRRDAFRSFRLAIPPGCAAEKWFRQQQTAAAYFNFSRKVAVDYFFRQCQMRRNQRIDAVRAKKQQVPSNHTQLTGLSFVERRDLEASASRAMHPDAQQHGVRPDIQPCSAPASPIGPNPNSSSRCQGASSSGSGGLGGGDELGSPRLLAGDGGFAHWGAGSSGRSSQVGRCVVPGVAWYVPQPSDLSLFAVVRYTGQRFRPTKLLPAANC